jgi:hypothetical protein
VLISAIGLNTFVFVFSDEVGDSGTVVVFAVVEYGTLEALRQFPEFYLRPELVIVLVVYVPEVDALKELLFIDVVARG